MNLPVNIFSESIPEWILLTLGLIVAFAITSATIPSIVVISRLKNLCNTPNNRTSHNGIIPNLGGIGIFIGLILSTVIFAGSLFIFELKYIISGLIIIFFVGLKDDILIIDPTKKLAGQIFAAFLVVIFADIRITSLFGIFHILQLPYLFSVILTIFVFIVIMNGFNLIDGIDGLASGIGILTSSVFGMWFWMTGDTAYAIFSFSFVGSLIAFFRFNVFGRKNKIFMGDTGSMVAGFAVGIMACRFLQLVPSSEGDLAINSAPGVVFGLLVIPLFDSLRVFVLRISQGISPFKADRQHIHHRLLELGFTHLKSTLFLISANIFFILISYILRNIGTILLLSIILSLGSLLSYFLVVFANKKRVKNPRFYIGIGTIEEREKMQKRKTLTTFVQSDYN